MERSIEILRLRDCSGERFPRNKNRILGYRNPVKYYGKRLQRVEYSPVKKTKRRYKKIGLRHRKQLGPKSHLRS